MRPAAALLRSPAQTFTQAALAVLFAALSFFAVSACDAGSETEADELGSATSALDTQDFRITKAEWRAASRELRVEGRGRNGTSVLLTDAASGTSLGTAAIREERWRVSKLGPSPVPCRVRATSSGIVRERAVTNAPAGCGATAAPTLGGLTVTAPASVDERTSTPLRATASWSDGSLLDVTGTALWTSDSPFAVVSSAGLLTTLDVQVTLTATVTATYSSGGVTRSATNVITVRDVAAPPPVPVTGSHAGRFAQFEGTRTCLTCHEAEAREMHASEHYQWQGATGDIVNSDGAPGGKINGINDFCIYAPINWLGKLTNVDGNVVDGGCGRCHTGLGKKPTALADQGQLENIDCLLCHSGSYKRKVDLVNGAYAFVPDTAAMSVSLLQAASDITRPDRGRCLDCHSKSGGGNNFKRGDLEEAHRNPPRSVDVHMAATADGGAGLQCTSCHTTTAHRIAGRGSDLLPRDSTAQVACTNCHDDRPHASGDLNDHTARVSCTVCHIPAFARGGAPTDMVRDYREAEVDAASRLYHPKMTKQANVTPEYRWWNGTSRFYFFGDAALPGESGRVVMSEPEGSATDPSAKIHAFKHHLGIQPVDPESARLLPLKIAFFFQSADLERAVREGAAAVGWPLAAWGFAETERWLGIFHEVAPADQALTCGACHDGGTRLDFGALGYTPLETRNGRPLCASCHGDKSGAWSASELFRRVHAKHVDDKRIACASCHAFSRP